MQRHLRWVALAAVAVGLLALQLHIQWSDRTGTAREESMEALRREAAVYLPETVDRPALSSLAPQAEPVRLASRTPSAGDWDSLFAAWDARRRDQEAMARWEPVRGLVRDAARGQEAALLDPSRQNLLTEALAPNEDIIDGVVTLTRRGAALPRVRTVSEERELHARLSAFSELLEADALRRANDGDYRGAIEGVTAKTALTDGSRFLHYPGSPVTLHVVDEALRRAPVNLPCWDNFLAQLEQSRRHDTFTKAMAGNAARVLDRYAGFPKSPGKSIAGDPAGFLERWAYRYPGAPVYNGHMRRFSESMTELLRLAPRPYHEVADRVQDLCTALPEDGSLLSLRCHWVAALRDSARRFALQADHEAHIDLTVLAIRLERFRARHGVYPDALDALAADAREPLPEDPRSGRPYGYRLTERRFDLYAPGPGASPGEGKRLRWPG